MENTTFGTLRRYLLVNCCYSTDEMKHYDVLIYNNIYRIFSLIIDRDFDDDIYIFGIHIDHFKITFTDGETPFVEVFNCEDGSKLIIKDLMVNMEKIPIKRYISVSPVKSARN